MKKEISILTLIIIILISSCKENPIPKPRAYFRISFPEKEYQQYESDCHYTFEYPIYSKITVDNDALSEPCWLNLNFPLYKATIHLTYKKIENNNLQELLDDSHTLVYKHVVKADAINDVLYIDDSLKIYATVFNIEGNAASPLQFHATDSVNHFLRASLYFRVSPNKDSLFSSIVFLKKDVRHLIESLEWK